jgi:hypothetical protein
MEMAPTDEEGGKLERGDIAAPEQRIVHGFHYDEGEWNDAAEKKAGGQPPSACAFEPRSDAGRAADQSQACLKNCGSAVHHWKKARAEVIARLQRGRMLDE